MKLLAFQELAHITEATLLVDIDTILFRAC